MTSDSVPLGLSDLDRVPELTDESGFTVPPVSHEELIARVPGRLDEVDL